MTDFRLAGPDDDARLRAVLRANGLPTWVEMAMQYEPSYFAAHNWFGHDWAVLAEERGATVGMYSAGIKPVHLDGRAERIGYLGGLRVNTEHRHRIRHLRAGYASIPALAPERGTRDWWFTVVSADNAAARRLLEAGVRGLPVYRPLGDYLTLALPTARAQRNGAWRVARADEAATLIAFHNAQAAQLQLSPVLDAALVARIGLEHFRVHERGGALAGVVALWDQRAFKQIVARRYRAPLGALIPLYNLAARLTRRIPLPRTGGVLAQCHLAFLALDETATHDGLALMRDLLAHCATPIAALGLHAGHALIGQLEPLRALRYPARVYAVGADAAPLRKARPVQPEVALL
jgi:hypothetical protein